MGGGETGAVLLLVRQVARYLPICCAKTNACCHCLATTPASSTALQVDALQAQASVIHFPVALDQSVSQCLGISKGQTLVSESRQPRREGIDLCGAHRRAMGPAPAVRICTGFVGGWLLRGGEFF